MPHKMLTKLMLRNLLITILILCVAISNHSFKIEPRMAVSTIQINGLSNQLMSDLSNTVSTHIS